MTNALCVAPQCFTDLDVVSDPSFMVGTMTDEVDAAGKVCRRCGEWKSFGLFPKNNKMRDGHNSHCRACASELTRMSQARRTGKTLPVVKKNHRPRAACVRDEAGILISKVCPDCGELKQSGLFSRNRNTKDSINTYCKPCMAIRSKESIERLHGSTREYHLRRRYGISSMEFDEMLTEQGGSCAICREQPAKHVDHDHTTGEVRALLCFTCNCALGNLRDRPELGRAAATYLETWHDRLPAEKTSQAWRTVTVTDRQSRLVFQTRKSTVREGPDGVFAILRHAA